MNELILQPPRLGVALAATGVRAGAERAQALAVAMGIEFLGKVDHRTRSDYDFLLCFEDQGLCLHVCGPDAPGPILCDLATGAARHRRLYGGGRSQTIAKATGLAVRPDLYIADLTAGLGQDAFTLASLGARVVIVERHPVVYHLLEDGLCRAVVAGAADAALAAILARLELCSGDSCLWLQQARGGQAPDVVYLDPMFPARRKAAGVRKSMAAFHRLVGADHDADRLLAIALEVAIFRVVVKRPAKAPFLGDKRPDYSLTGKSVRFDIYTIRSIRA